VIHKLDKPAKKGRAVMLEAAKLKLHEIRALNKLNRQK
jgi:hypothetical protein